MSYDNEDVVPSRTAARYSVSSASDSSRRARYARARSVTTTADATMAMPDPTSTASTPSSRTSSLRANASSFMSSETVNPIPPSTPTVAIEKNDSDERPGERKIRVATTPNSVMPMTLPTGSAMTTAQNVGRAR